MNTISQISPGPSRKRLAVRPWFLLLVLGAAALIAWSAWPSASSSGISSIDLSRADGKPRFEATSYPNTDISKLTFGQRLFWTWMDYKRRHNPNPKATLFPPCPVQLCSIQGLLNQCMVTSGTKYLIAVEVLGGTVNFGHTNKLNGVQWVSAFEQALTNQPIWFYDYANKRGFNDSLLLIRERKDLVKIVPRSKLSDYQAAGLVKANSVETSGK